MFSVYLELQHNFEEDSTLQIRQPNPSSRNETETTKLGTY